VIILIAGVFGGVVRGYSGSGFALAAMPILTIVLPPVTAVPVYRSISLSLLAAAMTIAIITASLAVLKKIGVQQ
jgi:uncharacterized membrane protein YfcA